jgi:hypothetical protein
MTVLSPSALTACGTHPPVIEQSMTLEPSPSVGGAVVGSVLRLRHCGRDAPHQQVATEVEALARSYPRHEVDEGEDERMWIRGGWCGRVAG